jgi:energy-converting hydrogenase Eha subunit G
MSSLVSSLGRLSNLTILFTSPSFSKQIIVTNGALAQASGTGVALAASGKLYIAVGAYANAMPTSTSSTIAFAVKVLASSGDYTQYIVTLTVG